MLERVVTVEDLEAAPGGTAGRMLVAACHRRGLSVRYDRGLLVLACQQCAREVIRVAVAHRPEKFLVASGPLGDPPPMSPMPKGWRKPEDAKRLEKHEVHALLQAALYVERDPRAFYLFALMYLLALRVGEAVLLRWDYIGPLDAAGMPVSVRVPTLKQRELHPPLLSVPVLSHPKLILAAFNRRRRPHAQRHVSSPWLFASTDPTKHVSIRQVAYLFALCRDAAKLNPRFTPHALRYAAAGALGDWEVARLGMLEPSPRTVTAFLRHSTRTATETYMVRTLTAWGRYKGALDLPALRPAAAPALEPPAA